MARIVTSPGGDPVRIEPDTTWQRASIRGSLNEGWPSKMPILGALWVHGSYSSGSGQGTTEALWNDARVFGYQGGESAPMNGVLKGAQMELSVARVIRGKRCFDIRLIALPRTWYDRLVAEYGPATEPSAPDEVAAEPAVVEPMEPVATAVVDYVEAATAGATNGHTVAPASVPATDAVEDFVVGEHVDWEPAPIELNIAGVVAMQLLTRVVEIISSGMAPAHGESLRLSQVESDLREVEHRLSLRLDENASMRRKLSLLGDELGATKLERDGLRQRLRIAEHNLHVAGSADVQRQVTEQVRAEIDRMMRARPGTERALAGDPA